MTTTVVVLADDLIWSSRLIAQLDEIGASPLAVRTAAAFAEALRSTDRVIVDLTARAYDGIEQVELAAAAGRPVLGIAQHDDLELRRRALAAGAERVYPYRRLFEHGPALLRRWLTAERDVDRADPGDAGADPGDPAGALAQAGRTALASALAEDAR